MPNLIRQYLPTLHRALQNNLGDEVVFTRGAVSMTVVVIGLQRGESAAARTGAALSAKAVLADFASWSPATPAEGDQVAFDGRTYRVAEIEPDPGTGAIRFWARLKAVA